MALFHRERTGEGQKIHVPMYEAFVGFVMNEHMQGRMYDPPVGEAGYRRMLTPHRRPFPTSDGYVCVLPYNDKHWGRFFTVAGKPELGKIRGLPISRRVRKTSMRFTKSSQRLWRNARQPTGLRR